METDFYWETVIHLKFCGEYLQYPIILRLTIQGGNLPCQCNIVVCAIGGDIDWFVQHVQYVVYMTFFQHLQVLKFEMADFVSFHTHKWHDILQCLSKGL